MKTWALKAADAGTLDPAPDEVVQSALSFGSRVWDTALAFANRQADERQTQMHRFPSPTASFRNSDR
jgi:hypothetical protein